MKIVTHPNVMLVCRVYGLSGRHQQAKALEWRVPMSLTRLWLQQDKDDKARRLRAEVYAWFSEGFDIADRQEAKAPREA